MRSRCSPLRRFHTTYSSNDRRHSPDSGLGSLRLRPRLHTGCAARRTGCQSCIRRRAAGHGSRTVVLHAADRHASRCSCVLGRRGTTGCSWTGSSSWAGRRRSCADCRAVTGCCSWGAAESSCRRCIGWIGAMASPRKSGFARRFHVSFDCHGWSPSLGWSWRRCGSNPAGCRSARGCWRSRYRRCRCWSIQSSVTMPVSSF